MRIYILLLFGLLPLVGFGCTHTDTTVSTPITPEVPQTNATTSVSETEEVSSPPEIPIPPPPLTYLTSQTDTTLYCNGSDMKSDEYRATLTEAHTDPRLVRDDTPERQINTIMDLATTGMCHDVISDLDITVSEGIALIPYIEGWAGKSIVMCSCVPEVEENLLQLPDITAVIWEDGSEYSRQASAITPTEIIIGTDLGAECTGYCQTEIHITPEQILFDKKGFTNEGYLSSIQETLSIAPTEWNVLQATINWEAFTTLPDESCPDCTSPAEWIQIETTSGEIATKRFNLDATPSTIDPLVNILHNIQETVFQQFYD